MSKKLFTEEEIIILKQNKYVKKVTSKGITYTDEFKRIFIDENGNGKLPRVIFEECGFNINIIGMQRVKSSASRWRTAFKNGGAIKLTLIILFIFANIIYLKFYLIFQCIMILHHILDKLQL